MKLYFRNAHGQERLIAEVIDEAAAMQEVQKFLDQHNFKSYYTRSWFAEGRKWLDVGSHTEYFIIEED